MKITKTPQMVSIRRRNEIEANNGCYNCPCCGEYVGNRLHMARTWTDIGLFRFKNMKVDVYSCDECGCEWESDEYEY